MSQSLACSSRKRPDVIERALKSGYEPLSFLVEERVLESDAAKIPEQCAHVPMFAAPLDVIKRITGFNLTRGMLCEMRRKEMPDFDEFIRNTKHLAVLEDIENPTNVGAIFRSAVALGADGAILTSGCADPLYRRASRVSMVLDDRAVPIHDSMFDGLGKTAVVYGNEKTGISDSTLKKSDYVAKIPMQNGIDSLNVASAAAMAFYRFFLNLLIKVLNWRHYRLTNCVWREMNYTQDMAECLKMKHYKNILCLKIGIRRK